MPNPLAGNRATGKVAGKRGVRYCAVRALGRVWVKRLIQRPFHQGNGLVQKRLPAAARASYTSVRPDDRFPLILTVCPEGLAKKNPGPHLFSTPSTMHLLINTYVPNRCGCMARAWGDGWRNGREKDLKGSFSKTVKCLESDHNGSSFLWNGFVRRIAKRALNYSRGRLVGTMFPSWGVIQA